MNFTRNWKGLALMYVIACSVLVLPAPALAVPQTAADNTKVNAPDKQKTQKTADQQDNNRADVDITVRSAKPSSLTSHSPRTRTTSKS